MQVRSIKVNNFKSLVGFRTDLAKFNCLIGLNGVGKSTVLRFIDFLAQQVRGDITGWLDERHWKPKELVCGLPPRAMTIDFTVKLQGTEDGELTSWEALFTPKQLHCFLEKIETPGALLTVARGRLKIVDKYDRQGKAVLDERITFKYEGSVLSQLLTEDVPKSLVEFKEYLSTVKSLDLLSPENLRQRTRASSDSIGREGKRLSAFLHRRGARSRNQLAAELKKAYLHLETLNTKSLPYGWRKLEIEEAFNGGKLVTEARHINDGMLRLIAVLAELQQNENQFVLFDEIENGVNPELVEFLLDALISAPQQVMVTTHSPVILNYLDDDVARSGVIYLYKTEKGHTRSIPFFSIPSLAAKLKVMGPGEAFADTKLTDLGDEIAQVAAER